MSAERFFEAAAKTIIDYNAADAVKVAREAIAAGVDPLELMNKGFIPGIAKVGELFGMGRLFLPELIQSADAMKAATEVVNDALPADAERGKGIIVIGTVQGDIHDIGKTIVVSLMKANGFEVHDAGRDVPIEKLIERAEEVHANIIGTSALLTTTMEQQKKLELELKKAGLRDKYKTMVGGAPVTQRWADRIGADAYAMDAADGVQKALKILGKA